jgi:hypothetical protein
VREVERLGFPYWTPYLAGKTAKDFRYGANFAVASGTALNQLLFRKKHLNVGSITPYSLGVQMGWFKKVLAMLGSTEHGTYIISMKIAQVFLASLASKHVCTTFGLDADALHTHAIYYCVLRYVTRLGHMLSRHRFQIM